MGIRGFVAVLFALQVAACSQGDSPSTETPNTTSSNTDEVKVSSSVTVDQADVDWSMHGLTAAEERFSPLDQINVESVNELALAWYVDLPEARGQEATPLVVDGILYTTAAWSHVYALDAITGKQLWHYDPKVDKAVAVDGCCGPVNRGLAYSQGKVFVGAYDGRLIAIDALSGKLDWQVQTVDSNQSYTVTGAPRIANGKVFIGNGGAEFGVRGYVSAYDINTGDRLWRFYTVPGAPGKPQENSIHETTKTGWNGDYWKAGGGGTVWDSMAFDPELNLLYIGVGNGSPWNPRLRTAGKGDNLFLSSIVALNPDTGEYVWHYQTTPLDGWDYTATQHMILADLEIQGRVRKVIMQAPKNGFFYVLDRKSGELISAENYVEVNWASGIDENGRPIINDDAKYWETGERAVVLPSWAGGHNWHPMSYNPQSGLVYVPAHEMGFPYADDTNFKRSNLAPNMGLNLDAAVLPDKVDVIDHVKEISKGHLSAWDPLSQTEKWRVQYPGPWNGGVLSTAGQLVFQGSAAGFLNAYHAETGDKLWEFPAQSGIVAPPITYRINGEQYLSVSVGWGGIFPLLTGPLATISADPINRSRLLTFKLGGKASLPTPAQDKRALPVLADSLPADRDKAHRGQQTYERYCAGCHGTSAVGGGVVPDLRYSAAISSEQSFYTIVGEGVLASRGMVGFKRELSEARIDEVREYIIARNRFAHSIGDNARLSR